MASKKLFFLVFLSFFSFLSYAQFSSNSNDFWNNVRFGGSIGLGFTNGGFNGSISPSALYQFNDYFASGVNLNLNYSKFNDAEFLAYGGSVLSLFNPIPQLQFSAEFEQLRINRTFADTTSENYWSPALFLGLGYSTYNVTVGLRYDVLYKEDRSIYFNALMPFFRVYF